MQLGCIDQALHGVTETLRIAQNNSDEECINHCLAYLAMIAGMMGNYEDEIMMTEKALHHSFKLDNPRKLLSTAMQYACFEQYYQKKGVEVYTDFSR